MRRKWKSIVGRGSRGSVTMKGGVISIGAHLLLLLLQLLILLLPVGTVVRWVLTSGPTYSTDVTLRAVGVRRTSCFVQYTAPYTQE